jgi:hypothetical protein
MHVRNLSHHNVRHSTFTNQEPLMAFSLSQAKSICTASELSLAKASTRNEIGRFSVVQIRQKVDRARKLLDKWRDQSHSQRRAAKSTPHSRQADASSRSAEKAELFGEVVARFEARLATLEAKGPKGNPAPKRLPKRARSATHRADRADIRAELKDERAAMGGRKKPKPAKPTKSKPPAAPAMTIDEAFETQDGSTATERPPKPSIPAPKTGKGKRAHAGLGMTAIESAREFQGLRVTKGKQLRAETAAKQNRLQRSGIVRIQKNASALNKRRQAKRDAR